MPARLADCSTILQLSFGLNLLFPIVSRSFRNVRKYLNRQVELALIEDTVPQAATDNDDKNAIDKLVRTRYLYRAYVIFYIINCLIAFMLSISLSGLIAGSLWPDVKIDTLIVVIFTMLSIVVVPVIIFYWVENVPIIKTAIAKQIQEANHLNFIKLFVSLEKDFLPVERLLQAEKLRQTERRIRSFRNFFWKLNPINWMKQFHAYQAHKLVEEILKNDNKIKKPPIISIHLTIYILLLIMAIIAALRA